MALSVKNFGGGGSIGAVENLLVPTWDTNSNGGITMTNNGDGTYTFNGATTTVTANFICQFNFETGKTYKLVGCPKGGGNTLYRLYVRHNTANKSDFGDGVTFVADGGEQYIAIRFEVNQTVENLIFKPMLTTNLKATYKEFVKRVGGFTNLISVSTPTQTVNGVTFTNNGDGTITVNGTASSTAIFDIPLNIPTVSGKYYKYTGCPKGIALTVASNFVRLGTEQSGNKNEQGNGVIFEGNGSNITLCRIFVNGGQTVSNAVFKPMLTESLLPEYYDFVKGVEDTFASMGFTKYAIDTYTPTSDQNATVISGSSYGHKFAHSLGETPHFAVLWCPNLMKTDYYSVYKPYMVSHELAIQNPSAGDTSSKGTAVWFVSSTSSSGLRSRQYGNALGYCFKSDYVTFQCQSGHYLKSGEKYYIMTFV